MSGGVDLPTVPWAEAMGYAEAAETLGVHKTDISRRAVQARFGLQRCLVTPAARDQRRRFLLAESVLAARARRQDEHIFLAGRVKPKPGEEPQK